MVSEKSKKNLAFLFNVALFLFGLSTLINNIVKSFVNGLRVRIGNYDEIRESTWPIGNTTKISEELYVVKESYSVYNCQQSDYINSDDLGNYNFIKDGTTIAFFWVAEFIKLSISIVDLYVAIQIWRQIDIKPNSSTDETACQRCKNACICCLKITGKVLKIVFISTTYAIPTYLINAFDYDTPCLVARYNVIGTSWEYLIVLYYFSIVLYGLVSMGMIVSQFIEGCRKCGQDCLDDMKDRDEKTSLRCKFVVNIGSAILLALMIVWCFSLLTFFQMLFINYGPKFTAVAGAVDMIVRFGMQCAKNCHCCS